MICVHRAEESRIALCDDDPSLSLPFNLLNAEQQHKAEHNSNSRCIARLGEVEKGLKKGKRDSAVCDGICGPGMREI